MMILPVLNRMLWPRQESFRLNAPVMPDCLCHGLLMSVPLVNGFGMIYLSSCAPNIKRHAQGVPLVTQEPIDYPSTFIQVKL